MGTIELAAIYDFAIVGAWQSRQKKNEENKKMTYEIERQIIDFKFEVRKMANEMGIPAINVLRFIDNENAILSSIENGISPYAFCMSID
jgi:putative aminopeptidase FrvX